jgi:hypothetical protein
MGPKEDWDKIHNYKHPGNLTVRLTLFWTEPAANPAPALVKKAETMLKEHGLGLDVYINTQKSPAMTLKYSLAMDEYDWEEQSKAIRGLAHAAYQDTRPRLPVIFIPFRSYVKGEDCNTNGRTEKKMGWLPYVIINSGLNSPDNVTLLHEIGHAAECVHEAVGPSDVIQNFMSYGTNRTGIMRNQVLKIASAYFTK